MVSFYNTDHVNHWWSFAVVKDLFRYLEENANDTELSKIRKLYGVWNFLILHMIKNGADFALFNCIAFV